MLGTTRRSELVLDTENRSKLGAVAKSLSVNSVASTPLRSQTVSSMEATWERRGHGRFLRLFGSRFHH